VITTYLFIFPTLLIFSLVSKGNETPVIVTETKHVYVRLQGSVCVCRFLPPPHRNCASTGCEKIRGHVGDCHPISERRTLPVDNPHSASENHYGRAKSWMAEGIKLVKCRGVGMFVKLYFCVPYSFCLSNGGWNIFWCRGIVRFKPSNIKIRRWVLSKHSSVLQKSIDRSHVY